MRTRFLRGNTQENNGLTLPEGELSIDEERHALRLHDGVTPGGFEIAPFVPEVPNSGPGPDTLLGGDDQWGFYGEVPASEFITGDALASAIGLSAGTSQNTNTPWLKFNSGGQVIYVPKKPHRNNLSWEDIYQAGAVYGTGDMGPSPSGGDRVQDARVTIGDREYIVRLLRGASSDPTAAGSDGSWTGHDIDLSHGSEWNRLFYPIHSGEHTDDRNPSAHTDPHAAAFGSWASYSDDDLVVDYRSGNGSYSWTQEVSGDNTSYRVCRGSYGVSNLSRGTSASSNASRGWRAALVPVS